MKRVDVQSSAEDLCLISGQGKVRQIRAPDFALSSG